MMEPYSESLQESSPPKTFFKNILSYFSKLFCNYVYWIDRCNLLFHLGGRLQIYVVR